jgi:hypothetical protein
MVASHHADEAELLVARAQVGALTVSYRMFLLSLKLSINTFNYNHQWVFGNLSDPSFAEGQHSRPWTGPNPGLIYPIPMRMMSPYVSLSISSFEVSPLAR